MRIANCARRCLITAAAVLLFTWAQSPAFAQDFWVWDATESYPLSNGDLQLDLQIGVETGWFTADVPIGSAYIPGAVIPAHNDCNCNSIDAQTVQGSWSFYAETEEAGLYEWRSPAGMISSATVTPLPIAPPVCCATAPRTTPNTRIIIAKRTSTCW